MPASRHIASLESWNHTGPSPSPMIAVLCSGSYPTRVSCWPISELTTRSTSGISFGDSLCGERREGPCEAVYHRSDARPLGSMAAMSAGTMIVISLSLCVPPRSLHLCVETLLSHPPDSPHCRHVARHAERDQPERTYFRRRAIVFGEYSLFRSLYRNGSELSMVPLELWNCLELPGRRKARLGRAVWASYRIVGEVARRNPRK